MAVDIHPDALAALVNGYHGAPFDLLGPHAVAKDQVSVRVFRPSAQAITLVDAQSGERVAMERLHEAGFFEATVTADPADYRYYLEVKHAHGPTARLDDPYCFPLSLTDLDMHLLGEGRLLRSYEKLGAHVREVNDVRGVNFAVWAPNAERVSVIGDFNGWDGRVHPMQMRGASGVWELFIPGVEPGALYRYDLRSRFMGYYAQKADPYGFAGELRPRNASIVADLNGYTWNDAGWMKERAERNSLEAPMNVYEVHLGSWRHKNGDQWLTYRELAHELVEYVRDLGFTHVELLPVTEHPFDASWGYQVTGYYAPTSRYGTPEDFMYFVDYCHRHGIGVILDWVPAHFPKDGHALSYFDGTHLYEHSDPRLSEHPDWGTYIFNYGRNEVRNFLISNALFWLDKYHIDGLRVDAVSSMLYLDFGREAGQWISNKYGTNINLDAIDFIRQFNEAVHGEYPGTVTVAEESTSWAMVSRPTYVGGLGFTLKWNMGWMHDTLKYMQKDPLYRRYYHNQLTFSMMYAYSENFVLSLSHDEVVHLKGSLMTKMAGDWWQKFASLRLLFGYQATHPGKKLNFMGQEFGQWREWSEARSLDWFLLGWPMHQKLQAWVRDLNHFYLEQPALYELDYDPAGFRWIEVNNADESVFAYVRSSRKPGDVVLAVCNFTPVVRYHHRIGVPVGGFYREVLNSDSAFYGGSNVGNGGGVHSEASPSHGFDHSLTLTLPPLAIMLFKPE